MCDIYSLFIIIMVKVIRHKDNHQSQNFSYLYINLAYCASYFSLSMNLLQNF